MAKIDTSPTTPDRARRLRAGTFTAVGQVSEPVHLRGKFLLRASDAGSLVGGAIVLECSDDGGATWNVASAPDGSAPEWFAPVLLFPEAGDEDDLLFRARCTRLTSGAMGYRLSQ